MLGYFFVQSRKTTFIKAKLNKSVSRIEYLECKMLFKGNIYILYPGFASMNYGLIIEKPGGIYFILVNYDG